MNSERHAQQSRRDFLRTVALSAGVASLPGTVRAADAVEPAQAPAALEATVYFSLGPDEAAFVEALVTVLCPADEYTPSGVDCGLAVFIDRQLAGAFGKGERLYLRGPWRSGRPEDGYQLPLTPEKFFKVGLAAANRACGQKHGQDFSALSAADADAFLQDVADGKFSQAEVALAEWFNELVYPLFTQACFADPLYGGNRDKVFWKMVGYPGLPAVNGVNMVKYRGKPFPGSRAPKSIEDFS
ncbi:MAG: gluconate 2-dehydrogenase subunit 3 family protein [Opitutus sp.]